MVRAFAAMAATYELPPYELAAAADRYATVA